MDLYQQIGIAVGSKLSLDYIKRHMYCPQDHVDAELEWLQIRKQLLNLLSSDELLTKLKTRPTIEEPAKQQLVPRQLVVLGEAASRIRIRLRL